MAVATTSVNCEGKCCCRCHKCAGTGYHRYYDVAIPAPVYSNSGSDTCPRFDQCLPFTIPTELLSVDFTLLPYVSYFPDLFPLCNEEGEHTSWEFGSDSGTGCCPWYGQYAPPEDATCPFFFNGSYQVIFDHETLIVVVVHQSLVACPGLGANDYILFFVFTVDDGINCLEEKTYTYSGTFYSLVVGGPLVANDTQTSISYDFTGMQVTVTPVPGDYYQCGANADGTPYEEEEEILMAAVARAVGPTVAVRATPAAGRVALPAFAGACQALGARRTFNAGCSGYGCEWDCASTHPAVVAQHAGNRVVIPRDDCGPACPGYLAR